MNYVLESLGMQAEFIPAVDGKCLKNEDKNFYCLNKTMRIYGKKMLDNEVACYLSHYRIYERMAKESIEIALIMEDDLEILPAFPNVLNGLLKSNFQKWDVVRFESQRGRIITPKNKTDLGVKVCDLDGGFSLYRLGTHVLGFGAYLIKLAGAQKMLSYGRHIFMPIDQTMDRYWENTIVPYIVRPLLVQQSSAIKTSIGDRSRSAMEKRSLTAYIVHRCQRIKDGIHKRFYTIKNKIISI